MTFKYFLPAITINTFIIVFQLEKIIKKLDDNSKKNNTQNKPQNKPQSLSPIVEGCDNNSHAIYGEIK